MKNKKAIEKIMTIWWFFIWVIIIVCVVINVAIFTNREIDYRKIDATILANKISLCISQEKVDLFQDNIKEEDFVKNCSFYEDTFTEGIHAAKITIYDKSKNFEKNLVLGSEDMFVQCKIKEDTKANQYPDCDSREILIVKKTKDYVVNITTASNLFGKRILAQDIK